MKRPQLYHFLRERGREVGIKDGWGRGSRGRRTSMREEERGGRMLREEGRGGRRKGKGQGRKEEWGRRKGDGKRRKEKG